MEVAFTPDVLSISKANRGSNGNRCAVFFLRCCRGVIMTVCRSSLAMFRAPRPATQCCKTDSALGDCQYASDNFSLS